MWLPEAMIVAVDLDEATDALYAMAPSAFTAARDALVRDARGDGDRAGADAVKKLRRPTTSAWLANGLVRQRREEVDRLLTIGADLRRAQQELDAGELRKLSADRHQAIAALVRAASRLAAPSGVTVSPSVAEELQQTLEAATADPDAADSLRVGRLTEPLRYSGFGLESLGAVPSRSGRATSNSGAATRKGKAPPAPGPEDRDRRRAVEAELAGASREVEERRRQMKRVAEELRAARTELSRIDTQRARLSDRERELAGRLRRIEAELDAAEEGRRAAERALDRMP